MPPMPNDPGRLELHPAPPITIDFGDPRALVAYTVPLLMVLAAILVSRRRTPVATVWRLAQGAAVAALVAAGAALLAGLIWPAGGPVQVGAGGWPTAFGIILLLVTFIGWVITRYAATYLDGEPRQPVFGRWLLLTLGGSSLVVATDHLGVLVVAWMGTSLALQKLLLFYPDRPQAQMAAHKKFLVSRLADVCMISALLLLWATFGTLQIPALAAHVTAAAELGAGAQVAVLLLAMAALLKSAQLPFHGWLMQVMEAPTPVSALLHAGVVNLGGFVLIRLAALVTAVPAAQVLLVIAGSLTAVLAALVMSTRISIKVALAWSTCAQMGFMVMQCGLGLYEMALLHLVAHSLYKAHAFLASGGAVQQSIESRMTPPIAPPSVVARLGAALIAAAVVFAVTWLFGIGIALQPALVAMAAIVSLSLSPLLAGRVAGPAIRWQLRSVALSAVVASAYYGLHRLLHGWLPVAYGDALRLPSLPLAAWVGACFVLLFAVQSGLAVWPNSNLAQSLHARFYGGLFLDEWFTRLTLRVWPIRRPTTRITPASLVRAEIAR